MGWVPDLLSLPACMRLPSVWSIAACSGRRAHPARQRLRVYFAGRGTDSDLYTDCSSVLVRTGGKAGKRVKITFEGIGSTARVGWVCFFFMSAVHSWHL